ncbi:MAG: hypothetical protein R2681_14885 [Pyrinomonadaceae bacterium]
MKSASLQFFYILAFAIVAQTNAQTLTCSKPDGDVFDPKSETVLVLLKSTSPEVAKLRIVPLKTDSIQWTDIEPNKTIAVNLPLEKGENSFDIFGFDSEKDPVEGQKCMVSVKRKSSSGATTPGTENSGQTSRSENTGSQSASNDANSGSRQSKSETETRTQGKDFRAIVGLEIVGASGSPTEQQPFFDLYFSNPIGTRWGTSGIKKHMQLYIWGNTRFASSTVENIGSLSNFTIPTFTNNFIGSESSTKFNELVQSFEFRTGLELQLYKSPKSNGGLIPGRNSVSLILSGGAITPLNSERSTFFYEVPKVNEGADIDPRFKELFPDITTQKTIAFATPERERFLRQYFAGVRLKTHYLKSSNGTDQDRDDLVPGMFDITFGQNEAITNKLKGVILRLDGSMPVPIYGNNIFYIFGSAQMRLGKNVDKPLPSIFLKPSSSVELSNTDVFVVSADRNPFFRSNRDTFRIGFGIDLLKLFAPKSNGGSKQNEGSTTPESSKPERN